MLPRWPERYLQAAEISLKQRDFDAARTLLGRYLEARPTNPAGHLLFAQLERRSNRYDEAASHLDACQRYGGPADAIELEKGLSAIQRGVYNAELDRLLIERLNRKDSDEYVILEALAQGLLKNYRLPEAKACLNRMLMLEPNSSFALRRRAWIEFQAGNIDEAEADYRQSLEFDPEDRVARQELAQILIGIRKNGPEAAKHYERLWDGQRDSTIAVGLAQSWRLSDRTKEARQLLDEWLPTHPRDANVLAERGRIALDEQSLDEATRFLKLAVEISPYLDDANYGLYLCLMEQGRKAEAEQCQVRMKQSKKDREELAQLTRQLQAAPNDADLRCRIAEIFIRFGEEDEGVRWHNTTLQSHPKHRPTCLALANYFDKHGQPARAAEYRRLADESPK